MPTMRSENPKKSTKKTQRKTDGNVAWTYLFARTVKGSKSQQVCGRGTLILFTGLPSLKNSAFQRDSLHKADENVQGVLRPQEATCSNYEAILSSHWGQCDENAVQPNTWSNRIFDMRFQKQVTLLYACHYMLRKGFWINATPFLQETCGLQTSLATARGDTRRNKKISTRLFLARKGLHSYRLCTDYRFWS